MAIPDKYVKASKPDWMPPFLWELLTGGNDPASQALNLAQPVPFGAIRTLSTAAGPVVEYTGRDLLPKLLATIGAKGEAAPIVENIARTAILRRALARYGETDTPLLGQVIEALKQQGVPGWRKASPWAFGPREMVAGVHSPNARGILTSTAWPEWMLPTTNLHELLHAADYGARRTGAPRDPMAAQRLYDLYQTFGNPYRPTVFDAEEAAAELGARYLLGLPYATRRQWSVAQPQAEALLQSILADYLR